MRTEYDAVRRQSAACEGIGTTAGSTRVRRRSLRREAAVDECEHGEHDRARLHVDPVDAPDQDPDGDERDGRPEPEREERADRRAPRARADQRERQVDADEGPDGEEHLVEVDVVAEIEAEELGVADSDADEEHLQQEVADEPAAQPPRRSTGSPASGMSSKYDHHIENTSTKSAPSTIRSSDSRLPSDASSDTFTNDSPHTMIVSRPKRSTRWSSSIAASPSTRPKRYATTGTTMVASPMIQST